MVLTRLNEQQCRKMFLDETMHYPAFLDKLKGDVYTSVSARIISMLNDGRMTDNFCIKLDSDYVDAIDVSVILFPSEDIFDEHLYAESYLNSDGELDNGKLRKPKLSVKAPINDGLTDLGTIKYILSHELTHLYDDWNSIRNGYVAICLNQIDMEQIETFVPDVLNELRELGCELWNFRTKIKETSFFQNFILDCLERGNFEESRNILSIYGGVVQYYLDMLKKEEFKKYGPPLHFY